MPLQFGRSAFIKYDEETTYGTAVTTTISNRVTSVSLSRSQERERTTHLSQSSAAFAGATFDGFELAGGTIEMPVFLRVWVSYSRRQLVEHLQQPDPVHIHTYLNLQPCCHL